MTDDNFFSTTRRAWLGAMLGAAATGVGAQGLILHLNRIYIQIHRFELV